MRPETKAVLEKIAPDGATLAKWLRQIEGRPGTMSERTGLDLIVHGLLCPNLRQAFELYRGKCNLCTGVIGSYALDELAHDAGVDRDGLRDGIRGYLLEIDGEWGCTPARKCGCPCCSGRCGENHGK